MGKVTRHFRTTIASTLIAEYSGDVRTMDERVQDEIKFILAIMPKGTRWVSTQEEMITDLSIPFTLVFEHPKFEDGTVIDLDMVRDYYLDDKTGRVVNYNALLGVRYTKPDGSNVYNNRGL